MKPKFPRPPISSYALSGMREYLKNEAELKYKEMDEEWRVAYFKLLGAIEQLYAVTRNYENLHHLSHT